MVYIILILIGIMFEMPRWYWWVTIITAIIEIVEEIIEIIKDD